jgi:thiamine biosynthesis lipoprotein
MRFGGATLFRWGVPILALLLVLAVTARRPAPETLAETRFLMDTLVTVTLAGADEARAREAIAAAFDALSAVDGEMARVPGSPLWELNAAGGGELSPSLAAVVRVAQEWARKTAGAFDPTVSPLLDLWDVPRGPHPPPAPTEVQQTLAAVGWERVGWDGAGRRLALRGAALDLGGIAKGYALDRAAAALRDRDIENFIVDAGGDLLLAGTKGSRPWRVGIRHPREPGSFLRVVEPRAGALVTSGDYERAYVWEGRRIHHILDPRTGYPAAGCRSVTVWAHAAVDADALATAVFVLGPERGLALLEAEAGAEGLVVDADGRVRETTGFRATVPGGEGR